MASLASAVTGSRLPVVAERGRSTPSGRQPGSVAEETARLLDALLGAAPSATAGAPAPGPCPTCGHIGEPTATGAAQVCHLCPVCQLLRVVRAVRPETLDRLADLAAAVTDALREAAASRLREPADFSQGAERPTRPTVHDIAVEDIAVEDEDGLDMPAAGEPR